MHKLMETIRTLQQTVATSKADHKRVLDEVRAEQALRQDQFKFELDASRTDNEELCRDLQCMGERALGEHNPPIPVRDRPMPFSQAIMNVVYPPIS